MRYIYSIFDGRTTKMTDLFVKSCLANTNAIVLFVHTERSIINLMPHSRLKLIPIPNEDWLNKKMYCKIKTIDSLFLENGDEVFVLDTDLIIKTDIFDVFDKHVFDVGVTTRHYDYWYKINAGGWCFRYSEKFDLFLKFFISQIESPSWPPFMAFQQKFHHVGYLDWWCDQDFLCTIFENEPPIDFVLKDLGYEYNFCPSVEAKIPASFERAKKEILKAKNNNKIKVLHFKGKLKELCQ